LEVRWQTRLNFELQRRQFRIFQASGPVARLKAMRFHRPLGASVWPRPDVLTAHGGQRSTSTWCRQLRHIGFTLSFWGAGILASKWEYSPAHVPNRRQVPLFIWFSGSGVKTHADDPTSRAKE